ncbi:hypothetical protein ABW19_dt0205118 [Dactylella cylindrospora]|nr:hypothetical protein ABW19_dt0205118 [Dactylella cylindrospora]
MASPPPPPPPPPYSPPASKSTSSSWVSTDEIRSIIEAMRLSPAQHGPPASSSTPAIQHTLPSGPQSTSAMNITASTTSRTRARLRSIERELDELRRAMSGERAVVERLKREASADVELPTNEQESRLLQLKKDVQTAKAESPRRSVEGLFKIACSTDLLFLMDTTGSMGGHIEAAKNQVRSIMNDIRTTFLDEIDLRIAVVGYKDHGDTPNVQFLDFTRSVDNVHSFLNNLRAIGGNDEAEDVLGGIQQALNATWMQSTRCIIHIADAPPHGNNSHDSAGDHYATPGSEPHRLTYEPLIKQMVGLKINYALLRINRSTDRMAFNFFQIYLDASADCSLHQSNR